VSGAPEAGESDIEGAIREAREETGLDVAESIFALGYRYVYQLNPQRAARWLELYGPGVEEIPVETFAAEARRGGSRSWTSSMTSTRGARSPRPSDGSTGPARRRASRTDAQRSTCSVAGCSSVRRSADKPTVRRVERSRSGR
jgi:hypothetical protein